MAAAEALIDNLLRKELTGYEEAKGYKRLIEQHRYLKSELAQRLGCDKARITRALQVLDLPEHIIELTLGAGSPLTLTHVQELLPLRSNLIRLQKVARQAIEGGWTARRIREEVTRVPRTNQGAQSVRFDARGTEGPFRLVIRFHPNRSHDIRLIEEALRKAQEHLDNFQRTASSSWESFIRRLLFQPSHYRRPDSEFILFCMPKNISTSSKTFTSVLFCTWFSLSHCEAASRYRRRYPQPGGSQQENGFTMRGLKQG
jgi:hypothetical protein